MKTTNARKPTGKKRLAELEYKIEELELNTKSGMSSGMEIISLFAIKMSLAVAIEDGVFKDEDEYRARELMVRVRTKIEMIRQKQSA